MHLLHSAEYKKISGCSYFNILHRPDDSGQFATIIAHHGTTVYKVVLSFYPCRFMSFQDIFKDKTLRGTRYQRIGTVKE